MSVATEKYKAFKKRYEDARKELNDQATAAFQDFAAEIFADYPALESFGWTQYTPYFNDGDECTFGVYADSGDIYINGLRPGYREAVECKCGRSLEERRKSYYYFSDKLPSFCPACGTAVVVPEPAMAYEDQEKAASAIISMMQNFENDILKDIYGDHCKVTVNRNGKAQVDEYQHD